MSAEYAELAVTSNFSFLRGASHPEELVTAAAHLGYRAVAMTDRNSVAGVVRAHVAAKKAGIRLLVGVRLVLIDGFETLAFPENRGAYGRMTKLLTKGNRRAGKGQCVLNIEDLLDLEGAHVFVPLPPYEPGPDFEAGLRWMGEKFAGATYLAAARMYHGNDAARLEALGSLSARCKVPMVAINDVHYHAPNRRPLQDVLTCILEHCTIREAGFRLHANAERHLKSREEIARVFKGYEDAVARTLEVAARCRFSLDELAYEYPDEPTGESTTPQAELERLTWLGAKQRFPDGVPDKVRATIGHELGLIEELKYAPYFLTVDDIVRFARARGILCQGRGSAANSAVCFCLGITSVNPTEIDLLFERFVSSERNEPPDIDVDFEHERREEVIQYIYQKYGRHRAGIAATVVTYRTRSAIREVGKAMGLSLDTVSTLSGTVWGRSSSGMDRERVKELGLDPSDATLSQTLKLTHELIGFPRHLSQHVGGFVITKGSLDEVIPIANAAMEGRTYIEWDKDDLDALNILKIDILALGMLTCIRKAFALIEKHYGKAYDLATVPAEDDRVYDMICNADTVGVFQIESRAQMSMLPRLKPRKFYDLVIEIAIVRPGPIQGDMVHPYLRRRQGLEKVDFPSAELRQVLGKTLGVPLFQEQAMKIAIVGANFSPGEADQLRKAMATFRRTGQIGDFREKFITGMIGNSYTEAFAEQCFKQIEGFSDYGFPESHSASFALLAYVSSWLKCFYPDVFACALLNAQPMGFYSSSSIVRDFRDHRGETREVDINFSHWDHVLEKADDRRAMTDEGGGCHALRLGFRQVKGFKHEDAERIVAVRANGFDSVRDLYFRTSLSVRSIERLARADAFRSLGLDRRDALWAVQGLGAPTGERSAVEDLPLYAHALDKRFVTLQKEAEIALPSMTLGEHVMEDYASLKLSLKAHPVSFAREKLRAQGVKSAEELADHPADRIVSIAGLVLVRQRPGTASGVIFATLEDETGVANVIIWPKVFEANRATVLAARFLGVKGMLQREQSVVHVIARELTDLSAELQVLGDTAIIPPLKKLGRVAAILPKGRNFH
jgi:error-prone DNA polymerase